MQTLQKKRTHYFHKIKETDGSSKAVYLGTDPEKANERLTELKVARIRSSNKLISEMEKVQAKLNRIAPDQDFEKRLSDVHQQFHRERQAQVLSGTESIALRTIMLPSASILGLAGLIYVAFSHPSITGAAIDTAAVIAKSQTFGTGMLLIAGVMGISLLLFGVDYHHRHKDDRFRPPQ